LRIKNEGNGVVKTRGRLIGGPRPRAGIRRKYSGKNPKVKKSGGEISLRRKGRRSKETFIGKGEEGI